MPEINNSELLSWNDVSLLITERITRTPASNCPSVSYNNTDNIINLMKSDMNKIYIIDNTSAVRINLPELLTSDDIGIWAIFHKVNSGNLSVYASTNAKIENSSTNGFVINSNSSQIWASIGVFLAKLDFWKFAGAPLGTWTTI
jgi:hypothetical protein